MSAAEPAPANANRLDVPKRTDIKRRMAPPCSPEARVSSCRPVVEIRFLAGAPNRNRCCRMATGGAFQGPGYEFALRNDGVRGSSPSWRNHLVASLEWSGVIYGPLLFIMRRQAMVSCQVI